MTHPNSITMTPTAQTAVVDGVPVRVWDGTTADGRACVVFVALVGFPEGQTPAALEHELIRRPILNPEAN